MRVIFIVVATLATALAHPQERWPRPEWPQPEWPRPEWPPRPTMNPGWWDNERWWPTGPPRPEQNQRWPSWKRQQRQWQNKRWSWQQQWSRQNQQWPWQKQQWSRQNQQWPWQNQPQWSRQNQQWPWQNQQWSRQNQRWPWARPQRRWPWGNEKGSWAWEGMEQWQTWQNWQSWRDWQNWQSWQDWQNWQRWQEWQNWQRSNGQKPAWRGSWWWNGQDWSWNKCTQERYGRTPECPAKSCKDILKVNPWSGDGKFWLHIWGQDVVFPVWCDMSEGGWTLIARFPSGASFNERSGITNPTDMWWSGADFDDWLVTWPWPWRNDTVKPYRNRIVRYWGNRNIDIQRVRMVIIDEQRPVRALWFNANKTDKVSWFSSSKLERVWPEWTDLPKGTTMNNTGTGRLFAIEGDIRKSDEMYSPYERTWLINNRWNRSCSEDEGWLMAIDDRTSWPERSGRNTRTCPWERRWRGRGMHWVYSKLSTKARWSNNQDVGLAEGVLIYVW